MPPLVQFHGSLMTLTISMIERVQSMFSLLSTSRLLSMSQMYCIVSSEIGYFMKGTTPSSSPKPVHHSLHHNIIHYNTLCT